jgi:hypothetical protein
MKESVCKFMLEYQSDCERLKKSIQGKITEISIKCTEFVAQSRIRELEK